LAFFFFFFALLTEAARPQECQEKQTTTISYLIQSSLFPSFSLSLSLSLSPTI
jgi:hypothetical protein